MTLTLPREHWKALWKHMESRPEYVPACNELFNQLSGTDAPEARAELEIEQARELLSMAHGQLREAIERQVLAVSFDYS